MKLGTVTGKVYLKQQAEGLEEARILTVETEGNSVAALDRAGARPGDRVLLVMSHAASRYSMESPADAVVIGVVEDSHSDLGVDKTGALGL